MKGYRLAQLAFLLGIVALLAVSATARTNDDACSGIRGRATDYSGGMITGVTVRIINRASKQSVVVQTDGNGEYVVCLASGTYDLTASAPGFKTSKRKKIPVDRGKSTIDFVLTAGKEMIVDHEHP